MAEVHELMRFEKELKEEEQLILSMLSKIDEQLHALQVEHLQLLRANYPEDESVTQNTKVTNEETDANVANVKKDLDLAVPHVWQESEDDEEDESS